MITPIINGSYYSYDVDNWNQKKNEFSKVLKEQQYIRQETSDGLAMFFSDRGQHDYVNPFMNIFSEELNKFGVDMNAKTLLIKDIWSVRYKTGDYHTVHSHGNVPWSAVLYFDYDENEHTGTHFVTSHVNPSTNSSIITSPPAKEGMLMFFPANLLHFTLPNRSSKERIVISMDVDVTV